MRDIIRKEKVRCLFANDMIIHKNVIAREIISLTIKVQYIKLQKKYLHFFILTVSYPKINSAPNQK